MMPTIGLRESAWASATARQKAALRMVCERLDLGAPVRYQTGAAVVWLIFDDHRIGLRDMAILARAAFVLATMPEVNTREELYEAVKAGIVLPTDINYVTSNPWQETLSANNAPSWLQASAAVPDTLTPVAA